MTQLRVIKVVPGMGVEKGGVTTPVMKTMLRVRKKLAMEVMLGMRNMLARKVLRMRKTRWQKLQRMSRKTDVKDYGSE